MERSAVGLLRRLQLFEVLDQTWCPQPVRHGVTDYLEAITSRADIYQPIQAEIFRAIDDCGAARVVDLCSGGGGPWLSPRWRSALAQRTPLSVILTDKFPNDALSARLAADPQVKFVNFSVDAACVPDELRGFRTIFASFHHFPDTGARAVLGDAVRWWDGMVSCFRTRTPQELLALTTGFPQYQWTAGYARGQGMWLAPVYLIAKPKRASQGRPENQTCPN